MRRKFIAGNWKMFNGPKSTQKFFTEFDIELEKATNVLQAIHEGAEEVAFFVPSISLTAASQSVENLPIALGAQNVHWKENGAFTGEISVPMIIETGASHVIIGHSERRHIFYETDSEINEKIKASVNGGLTAVFCVGETLDERESNSTKDIIRNQFVEGLHGITEDMLNKIIIAYEPVWAIGTGKTASAEDAEEICRFIRTLVKDNFGVKASEEIIILYGGSVKPENTSAIISKENIDGVLVGGASLKPESFIKIAKNAL